MPSSPASRWPAIIWVTISTILLVLPGSAIPKENWLDAVHFDKWVHIGMFGLMAWLFCRSIKPVIYLFLLTGLICIAYGIAMEYVQRYFVVNRSFDLGDIAADSVGTVLGIMFSWYRYIKK